MIALAPLGELACPSGLVGGPFGSSLVGGDYQPSGVPVIRGTNLGTDKYLSGDYVYVSSEKVERDLRRNDAVPGDLIFTQRGTLGQVSLVPGGVDGRFVVSQSQMRLRIDTAKASAEYVYYACRTTSFYRQIIDAAISTGVPHINLGILSGLTIPLPATHCQRAIAQVLGALDDKIAADGQTRIMMERYLAARYQHATVADALTYDVGTIATFHNRFRIPLSARERDLRTGSVPYYGATGVFGHVDEPIFNERLVLVGEDGSVITDDGHPVVQYVWGPSWVNNHAHVLTGRTLSTELLAVALRQANVNHLVTGAVQPKLSMGKLKSLKVSIPGRDRLNDLEQLCNGQMRLSRVLAEETRTLTQLRDTLLPTLISGQLRVRDAEKQVEEVV